MREVFDVKLQSDNPSFPHFGTLQLQTVEGDAVLKEGYRRSVEETSEKIFQASGPGKTHGEEILSRGLRLRSRLQAIGSFQITAGGGTPLSSDQDMRETLDAWGGVHGTLELKHLGEEWVYGVRGKLRLALNTRMQPVGHSIVMKSHGRC